MNSSADAVYLDSSALVKLVVRESESDDLSVFLSNRHQRVSCALAGVEVMRAVRVHGDPAMLRARGILSRLFLLRLDDRLLEDAATMDPVPLRTLDAIHLAAARSVRDILSEFVTYDARLATAARQAGLTVVAPGASA